MASVATGNDVATLFFFTCYASAFVSKSSVWPCFLLMVAVCFLTLGRGKIIMRVYVISLAAASSTVLRYCGSLPESL